MCPQGKDLDSLFRSRLLVFERHKPRRKRLTWHDEQQQKRWTERGEGGETAGAVANACVRFPLANMFVWPQASVTVKGIVINRGNGVIFVNLTAISKCDSKVEIHVFYIFNTSLTSGVFRRTVLYGPKSMKVTWSTLMPPMYSNEKVFGLDSCLEPYKIMIVSYRSDCEA